MKPNATMSNATAGLLAIAFFGTLMLYLGWYLNFYDKTQLRPTAGFAILFFMIFALAPRLCAAEVDIDASSQANSRRIFIALSLLNPLVFFLQLLAMLDYLPSHARDDLLAWAAVAIAAGGR